MKRKVWYAEFPESAKMIGCKNARYVAQGINEALVPVICMHETCSCLASQECQEQTPEKGAGSEHQKSP